MTIIFSSPCVSNSKFYGNWEQVKDVTDGKSSDMPKGYSEYMTITEDEMEVFSVSENLLRHHKIFPFQIIDEFTIGLKSPDVFIVNYSFDGEYLIINIPDTKRYSYYKPYDGRLFLEKWLPEE